MTIKEFESLEINAQANAVWDGQFVSSRVVDDVFVQLYNLEGLYVEVHYDPMQNKVVAIKPMKHQAD
jgi:hypothetical protein